MEAGEVSRASGPIIIENLKPKGLGNLSLPQAWSRWVLEDFMLCAINCSLGSLKRTYKIWGIMTGSIAELPWKLLVTVQGKWLFINFSTGCRILASSSSLWHQKKKKKCLNSTENDTKYWKNSISMNLKSF